MLAKCATRCLFFYQCKLHVFFLPLVLSLSPGGAGCVESLCLGRSHFSTQSIHSAPLAVSKHIEKPTRFQARPEDRLTQKEATS